MNQYTITITRFPGAERPRGLETAMRSLPVPATMDLDVDAPRRGLTWRLESGEPFDAVHALVRSALGDQCHFALTCSATRDEPAAA